MSDSTYVSIDQNCHPLWDTIPKLAALARHGWQGVHCVEDIDVAFSRQGARPGESGLALLTERYYRGGHSDWGAALFAHDFLGRLPVDIRVLEPYTGRTTAALARLLETTIDALYERWSPSDNWQLVGSSYADDPRWHRLIGDVSLAEAGPHLMALYRHAREDLQERFPEAAVQGRLAAWFDAQESFAAGRIAAAPAAPLSELYRSWLQDALGGACRLALTSERFSLSRLAGNDPLLRLFLERYDAAGAAYNEALRETGVGMSPLRLSEGELPFFVTCRRDGRLVRAAAALQDGALVAGDRRWVLAGGALPVEAMERDGVVALAGKALLLVLQARLGAEPAALALPHQGSLYMPAAHAFERLLRAGGLLTAPAQPVLRVRFRFFEHWRGLATRVRLPPYLADSLGLEEGSADSVAAAISAGIAAARRDLETLRQPAGREAFWRARAGALAAERDGLEAERRRLAADPQRRAEAGLLWQRIKDIDRRQAEEQAEWVLSRLRILDVEYYDSRGALLPWCLALGGEGLCERLLEQADVTPEHA